MKKKNICTNQDCKKEYAPREYDDGYCSFECWEAVNCGNVPHPEREELSIIEVRSR